MNVLKKLIIICAVLLFMFTQNVYAKTYLETVHEDYYKILEEENKPQGDDYITRGEFVALLMNSFGYTSDLYLCTFYDVYESEWDYKYIASAQNKNITVGDGENEFNSDAYLRVQDAIVFLSRAYRIDSMDIGKYSQNDEIGAEEYARDFVGYALNEGIYPQINGVYYKGYDKISVTDALDLMNKYDELSKIGFGSVKFLKGYPKTEDSGRSSSILIKLKTDKPCVLYYKMVEKNGNYVDYTPQVESVDSFLTSISVANTEVSVNIPAEQRKAYDIFFVLEGEDGKKSGIYSLRNVSVLPFTLGNGTKQNPYKIYSAYQFEQIRNYPDKCFELCTDIEYNKDWIPIGSMFNEENFSGVFDGGGHSITGIRIDVMDNAGLFAELDNATVKNLYIDAVVKGNRYVGVIAGISNGATVSDCHVGGVVFAEENIAGGIVGKNDGEIINCLSAVYSVESESYAGGIAGINYGTIKNSLSAVERVSAGMYVSSVAGVNSGGRIENCVGASIEANDDLAIQSGRITTNKENGTTLNNYAYSDMLSGDNVYLGKDQPDGAEVSWSELTSLEFYKEKLNWDFLNKWTMKNAPAFMLPTLKNVKKPELTPGLTVYAPKKISTEAELKAIGENLNAHYYLSNNITLEYKNSNEDYWTPLGISDEYGSLHTSFTGTLDGRGYAIKNLKLSHIGGIMQYGLFGVLYGGTVRNLKITNVSGNVRGTVGAVAGVNYGLIENCHTSGTLNVYDRNGESLIGGICAINYTNILYSDSKMKIIADTESASLGGICGSNEGFIYDCTHDEQIKSIQGGKSSNVVVGGIAGSNYSGFIYSCYAYNSIDSDSNTGYLGGIVGLMNGGEVYMCSSGGKIHFASEKKNHSYAYAGGICGIISGGIVMNSFSQSDIETDSDTGYAGGISGLSENASIQNVYAINKILQRGNVENVYAGGITGYSESSYIQGNVAINPHIETYGAYGEICAYARGGEANNNYSYDSMRVNAKAKEFCVNGIKTDLKTLKNIDFFFAPVYSGGLLGWDSFEYGGQAWIKSDNPNYSFPVLYGVKNQDNFYNNINN